MVKIDKEKCIGLCASVCGEVFEMADNGKAKIKAQKNIPCVKEAIDSCPVLEILWGEGANLLKYIKNTNAINTTAPIKIHNTNMNKLNKICL